MIMKTRILLSLVALLLAANSVFASTNDYAGTIWAFEDASQNLAAAAEITPAKYPDSDTATVEQKMVRAYRPDGTAEAQDETFIKVLTEKGPARKPHADLGLHAAVFDGGRGQAGGGAAGWERDAGGRGGKFQGEHQ